MARSVDIVHKVSPIQKAFSDSYTLENCLMGPRGEGKTEAGLVAIHCHALEQQPEYLPMPWAVIRDTWKNLERTTLQSIIAPWPGSFAAKIKPYLKIRDGGASITFPGLWKLWLFGVDSKADLNKLQSMQLAGLWVEEAAPAADEDIGSGIGEDLFDIGITSLRHPLMTKDAADWLMQVYTPGLPFPPQLIPEGIELGALTPAGKIRNRRAQITMNYPDEDHWTWLRFFEMDHPDRSLFRIPRGMNKHIDNQYRANMYNALKSKPALLARLVEGKPAHVYQGEAVTPEYGERHRSAAILEPLKNAKMYRSWDGGLNPSCIFWQITPNGRIVVYDALRGENMGMKQFIITKVKPTLAAHYQEYTDWEDSGDPALNERDQSDSTQTAAMVINAELQASFIPGVTSWEQRRETIKDLLNRQIDGEPLILLSKRAVILHQAFAGGWHYTKTPTGAILKDKPVKDKHSHPADAFCHHVAKLYTFKQKAKPRPPIPRVAASYAYNPKTLQGAHR